MNYIQFNVGEKELKLRLDTKNTVALEKILGTNPVNELLKCSAGQLPTMDFVATTLHASLQKLEHGYTAPKVYELLDEYFDDGHTLVDAIPVLVEVFQVAGLIPKGNDEVPK